jgi:TPR repeat protein
LRIIYVKGVGVPVDKATGVGFMKRSCDGNSALGCKLLGVMHARGLGVARDDGRAAALRERACALGDKASCASP